MKEKHSIRGKLSDLNALQWSTAVKGILTGAITGVLVVLYRLGIETGTDTAVRAYGYLRQHPSLIPVWLLLIAAAGWGIVKLVRFEPMATGSGIPQVEGQLLDGLRIKWYTVLPVRFAAGLLGSLFGLSLGREGPSIQIGAAGSQAVAKRISKNKLEENYLITGGAAAGLSAAFNAPLSGVMFALEEVHRSFSGLILIAATTAALTSDMVSKYFFGLKPVLQFTATPALAERLYLWLVPLGILAGLIGAAINKALLGFQTLYGKLPAALRPAAALLLALPCGLFLPQVLGGGQNLIRMAEYGKTAAGMIAVCIIVKFLFTCTSFGSDIPGGIFMPILSIGALSGGLLGLAAVHFFGMPSSYISDFAVCAMAGAMAASVKAPVTSILLAAEMTGSLVHLLPVAVCSFLALLVSDLLHVTPIYEALLERILQGAGQAAKNEKPGGFVEIPVEMGSAVDGRKIREVDWPQGALIVGVRRGEQEMVPNGDTQIAAGDYLIILSSESAYRDINRHLRALCLARYDP